MLLTAGAGYGRIILPRFDGFCVLGHYPATTSYYEGQIASEKESVNRGRKIGTFSEAICFKAKSMNIITWLKIWLRAQEIRRMDRKIAAIRHARFYRG